MSTVADIKAALYSLTLAERVEVASCLNQWQDDAWDERMKSELAGGKLNQLLAKVDADIVQGKLHDLP